MHLSDTIQTAVTGITVNKTRSVLTTLGIIIGVGSVVLMVSMGNSFQGYILEQIESFGTNTMDIIPIGLEKFGGNVESLTVEDFEAVNRLSTVERVTPVIIVSDMVHYGNEEWSPLVFGTRQTIFGNYGLSLARGRLLDETDEDGARFVAVVSHQTAVDLFGDLDPLGRKIQIGEFAFTVVGVLEGQGSLLMQDLDKPVYIPFSTARAISGQKTLSFVTLKTIGDPALAKEDITLLLRERHRINNPENDPENDDFIARSAEQVTSIVNTVTLGLTVFLSLVAGISLLVGGIGIMNIMLVSVTERTREIGLRKAVGARKRDILLQFLLEAVSLTLTGGIIGIIGGATIGWLLSRLASSVLGEFSFALSLSSILLAVIMAVGTGLVFGIYPARRAAELSPMEALRYE
ncbi:MAG: ABC transporter permease [Candidatus Peregrinibacteria bacterium]|nr:ABC transporter permease [Candidatus Peregrinibacteria bacterium]